MKANYDANPSAPTLLGGQIYKYVKTQADSGLRYQDFGQFAGYMYSWTCAAGACDSAYPTLAWTQLTAPLVGGVCPHAGGCFLNLSTVCTNNGVSGNFSREYGGQLWLLYDQIYTGLSAGNRTTFLNQLNAMASCVTATGGPAGWVFRPLDTDQTGGDYFQMAMAEVSTGSYNTTLHGYWNDATRKIGGYAATAADGSTYRNAVKGYVTDFAAGGEWVESSVYNLNTVKIYAIYAEAMRSVQSPTDNYPEITTWQQDAAEQFMHVVSTPISGTSLPYQWGDTQTPDIRTLQPQFRFELCLGLAGLTAGTTIGPKIQGFCLTWLNNVAGGGSAGLTSIDPYPRGFLVFDGTSARGDYTTIAKTRFATGTGLYSGRNGWTSADTEVWFHMPRYMSFDRPNGADPIDHFTPVWGEFVMIKNGVFAINHPLTYGGPSLDPRGTSGLTLGGVPTIIGTYGPRLRSNNAHENDDTNGFMYSTGTQGGPIVRGSPAFFNMPANFAMEHTRSLVWLKGYDAVIVHDRANAKAPATVGYQAALKTWMDSRPRKELYIASPVSPTQGSGYLDWIYSGSNHTRVTMLLPPSLGIAVESEATVWNAAYYGIGTVSAGEKRYHTIITPSDQTTQFHTFLNCWDAYGTDTPGTCAVFQDTSNKVDAALFSKGGTNVLLAFNALQGQDLPERILVGGSGTYAAGMQEILDAARPRTTSYTIVATIPSGTTKMLLFDLSTAGGRTWTYSLNGGGSSALVPDSQGVAVVNTALTGAVTLAVATTGIPDLLISTTSPITAGQESTAYSFCFVATGGLAPYTWSKTWTLPTGVTLNTSTGCLSGTPSQNGVFAGSVSVADSQGVPDTATLNPVSLTIAAAATPTLITTTSLVDPTVNVSYAGSGSIAVTGGTGVYTCTISAGQLPTGMSLNSNCTTGITGAPTAADEFATFTVQACDNAGSPSCDTQDYQLHVLFENITSTRLDISGIGSTMITGFFGAPGIDFNTDCTVVVNGPGGGSKTRTSGPARRSFFFDGLTQSTQYDVTASCVGVAFETTRSITTIATGVGTGALELQFHTPVLPATAAKIKIDYGLASGSVTDNTTTGNCAAGCTVTLSGLVRGSVYVMQHTWLNSSNVAVTPTSYARYRVVQ